MYDLSHQIDSTDTASIPKAIDAQLEDIKSRIFSKAWLEAPDQDGLFPTNGDNFAAIELHKRRDIERYTKRGFMCQILAAGWHHKSVEQLEEIADTVGRDRILIMHGSLDRMIDYRHGDFLAKAMSDDHQDVKYIKFDGAGHVLHSEDRDRFARVLADFVGRTEGLRQARS